MKVYRFFFVNFVNFWKSFLKFFEIFLKFFWNFFEIFLKLFWNFFEIFLKFFEIFLIFFVISEKHYQFVTMTVLMASIMMKNRTPYIVRRKMWNWLMNIPTTSDGTILQKHFNKRSVAVSGNSKSEFDEISVKIKSWNFESLFAARKVL